MKIILRIVAWLLAAAVTFSTLGPPRYRPQAAAITHNGEHVLAFVLTGLAFAVAYQRQRVLVATLSVVLIGVLELLQLFVPGRMRGWRILWWMLSRRSPASRSLRSRAGSRARTGTPRLPNFKTP